MSEIEDYSLTPFLEREQTKENTLAAYKAGLEAGKRSVMPVACDKEQLERDIYIEPIMEVANRMRAKSLSMFDGLPVIEDVTGMLCAADGYVLLMGKKMFASWLARSK